MSDAFNALGPGDADPRSPAVPAIETDTPRPLGPGDDDPKSPALGTPIASAAPLGPGESAVDDDSDLIMLAPAAAGPGDPASGPRHVTHLPRRSPTVIPAALPVEDAPAEVHTTDTPSIADAIDHERIG